MARSDRYFQFPIRCLRLDKRICDVTTEEKKDAINGIIRWCLADLASKADEEEAWKIAETTIDRQPNVEDDGEFSTASLLWAASTLQITLGGGDLTVCQAAQARIDSRKGGNLQIRLRADLMWDAKKSWPWRDFATLCGIYAGIGSNRMRSLTMDGIGATAMGFNGQRERDVHDAKLLQLTVEQTKNDVRKLHGRGFFTKASANGRNYWYSHRMSAEELDNALVEMHSTKKTRDSANSRTRRIRERIAKQDPDIRIHRGSA